MRFIALILTITAFVPATFAVPVYVQDLELAQAIDHLHHERQVRVYLETGLAAFILSLMTVPAGLGIIRDIANDQAAPGYRMTSQWKLSKLLAKVPEGEFKWVALMAAIPLLGAWFVFDRAYTNPQKSDRLAVKYFSQLDRFFAQDVAWQYATATQNPDLRKFLIDLDHWFRLNYDDVSKGPRTDGQRFIPIPTEP